MTKNKAISENSLAFIVVDGGIKLDPYIQWHTLSTTNSGHATIVY